MQTVRSTWYEVWDKNGSKLLNAYDTVQFDNQREAKKAIKQSVLTATKNGYPPREFVLMIVDYIRTMDDDDITISQTKTIARA